MQWVLARDGRHQVVDQSFSLRHRMEGQVDLGVYITFVSDDGRRLTLPLVAVYAIVSR